MDIAPRFDGESSGMADMVEDTAIGRPIFGHCVDYILAMSLAGKGA